MVYAMGTDLIFGVYLKSGIMNTRETGIWMGGAAEKCVDAAGTCTEWSARRP